MVALKLVFQSLTSVAVVGSVASGGYYMFNLGEDQYYLVSSVVATTDTAAEENFFSDAKEKPTNPTSSPSGALFLNTVATEETGTGGGGDSTGGTSIPAGESGASTPVSEVTQQPSTTIPPVQDTSPVEEKTTTQNYTCKIKDKKTEDSECKLFSIAFDTTNKSIDLATINTFIKAQVDGKETNTTKITKTLKKTELTSKHFFILKASTSLIAPKMVEGKKTITLSSTDKNGADKDKSYATLTLVAQFKEDKILGKTNLAIVKTTSVDTVATNLSIPTSDSSKTYTCTLQNSEKSELKNCLIQALDSYDSSTPFDFSSTTIPTTQTSLTIADQKYYLIKWTDNQKFSHLEKEIYFDIKPAQPLTTTPEGTAATTPKQTIFSPISRLIVHPTSTAFSEVIIINK